MRHDVRQDFFPAKHRFIERGAERVHVHLFYRTKTQLSRFPEPGNPFRLQIFDAERIIAIRPRLDRNQMQNPLKPAGDFRGIQDSMCAGKTPPS